MHIIFVSILIIVFFLFYIFKSKTFEKYTNHKDVSIYIFVSKTCPHCVKYNNSMHQLIDMWAKSKSFNYKRIFPDDDPDKLFNKYNVQFVPMCIVVVNGNPHVLQKDINIENLTKFINAIV